MRRTTPNTPPGWQQWLAERAEARERARVVDAAFSGRYRRTRPRDADEAELLRRIGTSEDLIGPSAHDASDNRAARAG